MNLSESPMPKNITLEDKEKTLDDVVDFLRNNDFNERDINEPTLDVITDLAGVDIPWPTDLSRQKVLDKAVETV